MKIMKLKLVTLLIFAAITINLNAQEKELTDRLLHRAEKNFIVTMDSDINSLVESAIFNMMVFKTRFPEWDFNDITKKLNKLSIEGKTVSIRYKAQLASMFISNPEFFGNFNIIDKDNPEKYFRMISDRIQDQIIAAN